MLKLLDFLKSANKLSTAIIIYCTIIAFSPLFLTYYCDRVQLTTGMNRPCAIVARSIIGWWWETQPYQQYKWLVHKLPFVSIVTCLLTVIIYRSFNNSKNMLLSAIIFIILAQICAKIIFVIDVPYIQWLDQSEPLPYIELPPDY